VSGGSPSAELEPGSYRDRNGRVFYRDGEVYRGLAPGGLVAWEAVAASAFFRRLVAAGKVVATERVELPPELAAEWSGLLRHERVPFVSYPYEWCFGMLREAALLQLEVLDAALDEGFSLKDATPYNVLWRGGRPVFIDVLSFHRLRPGEPWVGYRQFCELCLYPLLLAAYRGVPFQPWLRGRLEGITPQEADRLLGGRTRFRRGVLSHVWLHARSAERWDRSTAREVKGALAGAGFHRELIRANVRRLRRLVERLESPWRSSAWAAYGDDPGYTAGDREEKERFVRAAAAERRPALAWDLGANTGTYSRLVAEHAGAVVALERDLPAVERLFEESRRAGGGKVLPLVHDVADPSPALGWGGRERKTLEQRGRPDLVLCLALVHHLVIGANLRLGELLDWLRGLGGDLVIELVGRDDPMVRRLLAQKDEAYEDYGEAVFEAALGERFEVLRRQPLASGTRTLYWARRRG
jgi:SAM-dependent methyltransferase